ncbi:MAG TPA: hypothetical protein VIV60_20510 [Polyangiaceae bacterium]
MSLKLRPLAVPIPRLKKSIGLGDVVKRATTAIGVRPCGGCGRRAESLNRTIVFRPTRRT